MNADQPSAGRIDGREHRLSVRVYYEDTDFTGVIYHANYARYFERGRSDFLRLAGADHCALLALETPLAFAVARLTIDFLSPGRIDDALSVATTFETLAGARLTIAQSVWRADRLLARAEVQVACIDSNGRPRRLPANFAAKLQPFLRVEG